MTEEDKLAPAEGDRGGTTCSGGARGTTCACGGTHTNLSDEMPHVCANVAF